MRQFVVAGLLIMASAALVAQEDVLRPNGRPGGAAGGSSSSSSGRDHFILGIEGGLNMNFFGQDYRSDPEITDSPDNVLSSGFGLSPEFGVFADLPLNNMFGLQFRLAYDGKYAGNTETWIIDAVPTLIDGIEDVQGFQTVEMETEASWNLVVHNLAIAALFRVDIVDELFATLGPIALIQVGDATRSDRLTRLSPDDTFITVDYEGNPGQYEEITRDVTAATNILPTDPSFQPIYPPAAFNSTRFGLELGVGYRFMLSPTIYLAPNVRYQYFFTPQNDEFVGLDLSRQPTQGAAESFFGAASLNTLAIILQLGFEL